MSKLTMVLALASLALVHSAFATDIYVSNGKLIADIDDSNEAYKFYSVLRAKENTADQGFTKYVDLQDGKHHLSLWCTFDHRSSCRVSYENAAGKYFAENDNSGIFFFENNFGAKMYEMLDMQPATGWGSLRKTFITGDGRFEISCTWYAKNPAPGCMLEVIRSK